MLRANSLPGVLAEGFGAGFGCSAGGATGATSVVALATGAGGAGPGCVDGDWVGGAASPPQAARITPKKGINRRKLMVGSLSYVHIARIREVLGTDVKVRSAAT